MAAKLRFSRDVLDGKHKEKSEDFATEARDSDSEEEEFDLS
jgi:hypothetical protein